MPVIQRASRNRFTEADTSDDTAEWEHSEDESASFSPKALPRRSPAKNRHKMVVQVHPLLWLGVGMLAMLLLWVALSAFFGWVHTVLDDVQYGRPRTFQMDAWVDHSEQSGTPSHFIALNLNRHIEIIEIPGGDATHTHVSMLGHSCTELVMNWFRSPWLLPISIVIISWI
jgi:hypothetical protein